MYWLFFLVGVNVSISIGDMREVYIAQDEVKITKMYELLKVKQHLSDDEECYFAVFECLQAKYSYNPYAKYNYFTSGYKRLNNLILRYPTNPEYRYHRIMIETNAPSFLLEKKHIKEDKSIILRFNKSTHPLYKQMVKAIE